MLRVEAPRTQLTARRPTHAQAAPAPQNGVHMQVTKRDGRTEAYDRQKIASSSLRVDSTSLR